MPDFNPNDMDALFREGADRHEFEYKEDSWKLMEAKLDKRDNRKRFVLFLLGLAFLIGLMFVYSLVQNPSTGDKSNSNEPTSFAQTEIQQHENVNLHNDLNNDQGLEQSKNNKTKNVDVETIKEHTISNTKKPKASTRTQNNKQNKQSDNHLYKEDVEKSLIENSRLNEEIFRIGRQGKTNNNLVAESKETSINASRKIEVLSFPDINNRTPNKIRAKKYEFIPLFARKTDSSVTESISPSNGLALTIFANPEWSSVGLLKSPKVGWSIGAKVGYQFADKFEISIGLALSKKIYKSAGAEYTMVGGWYDNVEPMRVDAKCTVLEIPVGLSYYLSGYRNSGFFADIGISSYMLHSEWYGFEYDDALVRPERYEEVVEEGQNKHLVGVGRLAFGYQKILSSNIAIQVAPYLQFPLTGIGAGKVNVYSAGIQVGLKFHTKK